MVDFSALAFKKKKKTKERRNNEKKKMAAKWKEKGKKKMK